MDIQKYQVQRPVIKQYLLDHPGLTDPAAITILSQMYNLPLVATTHFIAEIRGWTQSIRAEATRHMKYNFNHEVFDGGKRISCLVEGLLLLDKEAPFDHAKEALKEDSPQAKNQRSYYELTREREFQIEQEAVRNSQPKNKPQIEYS